MYHKRDSYLQDESRNKKAEHHLFDLSWEHEGHQHKFFATLHTFTNDHNDAASIDVQVTNRF